LREGVESIIFEPAKKTAERWKDLPITFLHGDPKIANMALMPDGRLAVFDWALAGRGPCGIDLGWYIAVNATRLARTKDEIISLYRAFLESHLHYPIEEEIWTRMVDFAVLAGAKMLLWSKALGYLSGTERGRNEWDWWTQKLKTVAEKNL
jgi:aminoglycoside phosphotransferase (APT) family kinase protein